MLCRLHRDAIRNYDAAVSDLDQRIAQKAAPWQREIDLLKTIPGFGDVVAQAWIAEIGPAPHQWFPSPGKLASWVTLAPGNHVSAGKRKHGKTGDAGTYVKPILVQAAWPAIKGRNWLQARYDRLVRRMGGARNPGARKKAILAIAHTLLKIACAVLKSGRPYQEPGADFCTRRESPVQRQAWLEAQIQQLYPGCAVTVTVTPPPGGPPGGPTTEAALTPALPAS